MLDYQWFQSQVYIGDNGKIHLPHVSIDITKGCNMNCPQCSHLSPMMHGYFLKEELTDSIIAWSQKLQPKRFAILGGEPLLHPDFQELVLLTHQHWKESEIVIVSNGTLLHKIDDSFLRKISKIGRIRFDISQHSDSSGWIKKFETEKSRFAFYNISMTLRKSYSEWFVIYQQDFNGRYIPYQSNPQKAWNNCFGKSFYKIHEGKLFYRMFHFCLS
jgi:organic radical activating enzyme